MDENTAMIWIKCESIWEIQYSGNSLIIKVQPRVASLNVVEKSWYFIAAHSQAWSMLRALVIMMRYSQFSRDLVSNDPHLRHGYRETQRSYGDDLVLF